MKKYRKHSEILSVVKTAALRDAPDGQTIDLLIPHLETPKQHQQIYDQSLSFMDKQIAHNTVGTLMGQIIRIWYTVKVIVKHNEYGEGPSI